MTDIPTTEELLRHIRNIYNDSIKGAAKWTTSLAEGLGQLCPDGHTWFHEIRGGNYGEYIVDYTWAPDHKEADDWMDNYHGLLLAMESEWGTTREKRWEDFVKVADVLADRRLFVGSVQRKDWADIQMIVGEHASWLKRHRHFPEDGEIGMVLNEAGDGHCGFWILRGTGMITTLDDLEW